MIDDMLAGFADHTTGVRFALLATADGFLLGSSQGTADLPANQLAATTAGVLQMSEVGTRFLDAGDPSNALIMLRDAIVLMRVAGGSTVAVVADADCDLGEVGEALERLAVYVESTQLGREQRL